MVSDHPLDLHVHNLLANKIDTIVKSIDSSINGNVPKCQPQNVFEKELVVESENLEEPPF